MTKPLNDVRIDYAIDIRFDSESSEYTIGLRAEGMNRIEYSDVSIHALFAEIGTDVKLHLIGKSKEPA